MDTSKRLLEIIDFDYEPLEGRKTVHEIVEHFRTRKGPVYLFNKEEADFINDQSIIDDAEKVMNHYVFGHQFDGPIVWDYNPTAETSRDNEWTWSLYRTIFWQQLARAYAITGDDRYVKEFTEQLKGFYETWPAEKHIQNTEFEVRVPFPGHAWRTIESGIRIYTTWLPVMEIFRRSPAFDDETWTVFLSSIHDHATFLMGHYSNHNRSSNWLSMESSALLQMGIMFPEMKDSASWRETGYRRVMHEIAYCFDEDGIHMERTPVYHLVASIAFLQAVELCRLNNIGIPPYAMTVLERSADFIYRIVKPDFTTPMLGDADRENLLTRRSDTSIYEGMNLSFFTDDLNEMRAYFKHMAKLFNRPDFLYLATGGKEGKPSDENHSAFREAGIYTMRGGFGDEDYVLTQMVKLERGEKSTHSHNDTAHVELMLRGEDILIDCGRYIYNTSIWKDWRHYFTSAVSHNTLYVDDHTMGEVPEVTRVRGVRGVCHQFTDDDRFFIIDISHNGYAFMDDPVFHRRHIVLAKKMHAAFIIDWIIGEGKSDHDMRLYWNFARPGVFKDGNDYIYQTQRGRKYRFIFSSDQDWHDDLYEGSENPKGGWASFGYPVRVPVSQVVLSRVGKAPASMAQAVVPDGALVDMRCSDGSFVIKGEGFEIVSTKDGVVCR
ncbi:MAG TPA: alginate lyase family protein [Candidatus Ornithospirochaeta stercorigallinarum]|nr:alginate lyase family protein [Candidatus Ornithospirochaeta stercorigallinarum]